MNLLLAVVRSVPCRGRPGRGSLLPVLPALPWLVAAWPPSRHPAAAPPLWQAAQRPAPPPANGRPTRGPNTLRGELTVNADKESGWGIRRGAIFGRQNRPGGRGEAAPSRGAGFQRGSRAGTLTRYRTDTIQPGLYNKAIHHRGQQQPLGQVGTPPPCQGISTWKQNWVQSKAARSNGTPIDQMTRLWLRWRAYGLNEFRMGTIMKGMDTTQRICIQT